jgi:uncharacterized protein YcfL
MKTIFALLAAAVLAGCSSNYRIQTTDGQVYQTQGQPVFHKGGYEFTDSNGQQRFITLVRVHSVE